MQRITMRSLFILLLGTCLACAGEEPEPAGDTEPARPAEKPSKPKKTSAKADDTYECTRQELISAIQRDRAATVEACLESGLYVDETDEDGFTPLYYAAKQDNAEMVRALIEGGADPDHQYDSDQATALSVAVAEGKKDSVNVLLEYGANPNIDVDGVAPLVTACSLGFDKISLALIDSGADVNVEAEEESTPLVHAALSGDTEVVAALITAGADVTKYGGRILEQIKDKRKHRQIYEMLVAEGAAIEEESEDEDVEGGHDEGSTSHVGDHLAQTR